MRLVEISESGQLPEGVLGNNLILSILESTLSLYRKAGFHPPWISYLAVKDNNPVGICAFKSPPHNGRVEIAYFTFSDYEGKGIATSMIDELIRVANDTVPSIQIVTQTLAEENVSTSILKKLGFDLVGSIIHPEDGIVWEWQRNASNTSQEAKD